MSRIIRIGTRDSQLAMWQAKTVQSQLEHLGYKTILNGGFRGESQMPVETEFK